MAQENRISVTLTEEALAEIQAAVAVLQKHLPFLLHLTADERMKYAKMGDKTVAFVNKSLDYAETNESLVPAFLNMEEYHKDMKLVNDLNGIARPLRSLLEGLEHTTMVAGSEAYSAALVFYSAVKMANQLNVQGVGAIYEDLRKRFPGRGPSATNGKRTPEPTV